MMQTDAVLEFLGLKDIDENTVENLDEEVEKLLLAEIEEILAEMAVEHADTDKYEKLSERLKTAAESYQIFERGRAETMKVEADIENAKKARTATVCNTAVKLAGIGLSAWLTRFYFGVEQGRPTPVRYINKCQDFLTRV